MSSSRIALAVLFMVFSAAVHAEAMRPASKRLPDWLDALLRQIDSGKVQYESVTLTVPEEKDAKSDQAKVEVISPEKFWRLAQLVELRAGTANMKNLTETGGPRRSAAEFEVALEAPTIRQADVDKLKPAAGEISLLLRHFQMDDQVRVAQFLVSRPAEISIFGKSVRRVPVRFMVTGARADVLSRLAEMAKPLPYAYLRGLRAAPNAGGLEVTVSLNLLVTEHEDVKLVGAAEQLAQQVSEKVAATAGAGVLVSATPGGSADAVILSLSGKARDANGARDALTALVQWPALKAFDELGWKNDGGNPVMTGLMHFSR